MSKFAQINLEPASPDGVPAVARPNIGIFRAMADDAITYARTDSE